jgi:hypothetical protein
VDRISAFVCASATIVIVLLIQVDVIVGITQGMLWFALTEGVSAVTARISNTLAKHKAGFEGKSLFVLCRLTWRYYNSLFFH